MHGYNESKLIGIETIKDKSYSHSALVTKAKRVFVDAKKNPGKGIKSFFRPNSENTFQKIKRVLY